uniref:RAP domain-containing protein n=1 Tax=Strongyloides stercoralis TaxID=6248 RepID=A0AAF5DH72_STRER
MLRFQRHILLLQRVNRLVKIKNTIIPRPFCTSTSNIDNELLNIMIPSSRKLDKEVHEPQYYQSKTLDDLELKIKQKRPENSVELAKVFEDLDKYITIENLPKVLFFFHNNQIATSIKAHIIGGAPDINSIVATSTIITKIFGTKYGNFNVLENDSEDFALLNSLLNQCYNSIKDVSFAELPLEKLVPLYFLLQKYNGEVLNKDLVNFLKLKMILHVNDTTSFELIFGILKGKKLTPDQYKTVFKKASELLPNLSLNDSASLMYNISITKERPLPLLQEIAQHMDFRKDESLTFKNLVKLAASLNSLSFTNTFIIRIICKQLIDNVNVFDDPNKLSSLFTSLSLMNCGSNAVWDLAEKWLNNNYRDVSLQNAIPLVMALSKVNSSPKTIEMPLNYFSNLITIKSFSNSNSWLRYVHAMTIFGKLTPRMAENVLKEEFINDLFDGKAEGVKTFLLTLIAQIDCSARNELAGFDRSNFSLNKYINSDKNLTEEMINVLYDKRAKNFVKRADVAIRRIVGSEKKCSGPQLVGGGILVNNIISYTPNNEVQIVDDWNKVINGSGKKFGFVYISNRQMMRDPETSLCVKENGTISLKIRLLEKLGFKVIRIHEYDIDRNVSAVGDIDYIKEEIKKHLIL